MRMIKQLALVALITTVIAFSAIGMGVTFVVLNLDASQQTRLLQGMKDFRCETAAKTGVKEDDCN